PYCRLKLNTEEEGKIICENCGIYRDELQAIATYGDMTRINNTNNSDYQNGENFRLAFYYHQGKIHIDFPENLERDVSDYCARNHILKRDLTPELMGDIFKSIKYPNYKGINLFLA